MAKKKVETKIEELLSWLSSKMGGDEELQSLLDRLPSSEDAIIYHGDIIDSFGWQEKKIIKRQIQICKAILATSSKQKQVNSRLNKLRNEIKGYLTTYENKQGELNKKIHFPKTNLQDLISSINKDFFQLDAFMNGTLKDYKYFGFNDAFSILFYEAKKRENFTYENCKLISNYWRLIQQITFDIDKCDFINQDAFNNNAFVNDTNEILFLNNYRIEDFDWFTTQDEIEEAEKKFSITDILKPKSFPNLPITEAHPDKKTIPKAKEKKSERTTLDYALFHYYKQEGKYELPFERNSTTTKREAIKQQGEKYDVGADSFANSYYSIFIKNRRISKTNIPHIKKAIEMLADYSKGRKKAKAELKEAELLHSTEIS